MDRPVSRLVVGAAQFGQAYGRSGRPQPRAPEVAEILRLATERQCMAIDTARAYGGSEAAVGLARRSGAGVELPVVTKIRPLSAHTGPEVAAAVRASLTESLSHLDVRHLDTVLLHRASDLHREAGAAVRALRAARHDGLLGRWGASVADPEELTAALAIADLGYVQLPFNVVDRRWLTPRVKRALADRPDVTIAARSTFLQGLLLRPDAALWPRGAHPDAPTARDALAALAASTERTAAGVCLGYVLAQPWIHAVVVGVRSAAQLDQIADEISRGPLTQKEVRDLESSIPPGSPLLVNPALWPPRGEDPT